MNYVTLDLDHFDFYCPITGKKICGMNEMNENVDSLMGYWVDEVLYEPVIKDPKLKLAWDVLVNQLDTKDEYVSSDDLKKC